VLLEKIAAAFSDDVWVVAPEVEQSGASHSWSLADPIRMREAGPHRYAIQGTPTDCVVIACDYLLKERQPDLLLSGINRGLNLAEDLTSHGCDPAQGLTRQGVRTKLEIRADDRIDARGFPYFWLKFHREVVNPWSDSDLAAIEANAVSVTPLHLDLTNHEMIPALRSALAEVSLDSLTS
jgi:broad specificity polyphosphatase/5'/3'-nucleotidase SurE